ncbi:PREDICTED: aminopeptidase N-like [Eufriesea mexicana]|uniref:aminopeptidase N-like n=1 Tax=Eufriesea mexicana TaxID=516756 RepID=UPI00083C5B1F|nr:PREDICTED: aminopeptidase N-like [Eufriesea mexicana]XP_017767300.1 PREDICTED: aminopeptidase N-like [Eufriesea mexicana]
MAKGLTPLLLALVLCQASLLLADIPQQDEPSYRLPGEAIPNIYELNITPNLEKFTFQGVAKITIEPRLDKDTITLNAKNLTISKISLLAVSDSTPIDLNGVLVPKQELLVIKLSQKLDNNKQYVLTVEYTGELNDQKRGFYRSRYFDKDDNVKYVAATHFEPTGARLAFPCWDEPAYKANYSISITHSKNHRAISNMRPVGNLMDAGGDLLLTKFETSPKMSSYLVAFVVSDYDNTQSNDSFFKVWTKPHALNQTYYALEKGEQILKELDKYTEIEFQNYIDKMDQVSLKDFAPSAMENWGLVTYRESALLYQDGVTTTRTKQSITTIIAHEFAHQWFGDLVSPQWWTYIWLNEGFANYFQYHILQSLLPEWRLNEVFVVDNTQGSAFVADADENVRPMNKEVTTPQEISALFDSIAYQKAGSVIRMMSHILSQETFQKGLQNYLTIHKASNTNSTDLLNALGDAANSTFGDDKVSFTTLMNEWVNKPGYPVVTVKKDKDGKCVVTQERFLLNNNKDNTKWWVPITYFTQSSVNDKTTPVAWLKPTVNDTTLTVDKDGWVIFNTLQAGYYRVNYDEENWKLLTNYLNTDNYSHIYPVNRAQLIDDALNMARTNRLNYTVALSLTLYLQREVDYIPWQTTFRNLNFLQNLIRTSEQYSVFKSYISYIMQGLTKNVQYVPQQNDTDVTKLLKVNAFRWACRAEVKDCVNYAIEEFNNWRLDANHSLDVNLKNNILCAALRSANSSAWNETLKTLSSTKDEDERKSLLSVLACSESLEILENYLLLSLEENPPVPFHTAVQNVVSEHPSGVDIALKILINKYEGIKQLNDSDSVIKSSVDVISGAITNNDQYLQLSMFMANQGLTAEVLQTGLKKASKNMEWLQFNKGTVEQWLVTHKAHFNSANSMAVTSFFLILLSIFITRFY